MTAPRYIVSRRDGQEANLTHFLAQRPDPCGAVRWTFIRSRALRLSFEDAEGFAGWWNALPAIQRLGIAARVEDADPPPAMSQAA